MLSLMLVGTGLCARGEQRGALTPGSPPFFFPPLIMYSPIAWQSRRSKSFHLVSSWSHCATSSVHQLLPARRARPNQTNALAFSLHTNQAGALCQASSRPLPISLTWWKLACQMHHCEGKMWRLYVIDKLQLSSSQETKAWCTPNLFCTHRSQCIHNIIHCRSVDNGRALCWWQIACWW